MVIVKRLSKELDINVRQGASLTGNDRQRLSVLRGIFHQSPNNANNDQIGSGVGRRHIV